MSSPRTLSYLHCSTCQATTLHDYNRCPKCKTLNTMSSTPPMPVSKALDFGGHSHERAKQRINGLAARNRARAARNKILAGMGR